jgi:hypothetical protein
VVAEHRHELRALRRQWRERLDYRAVDLVGVAVLIHEVAEQHERVVRRLALDLVEHLVDGRGLGCVTGAGVPSDGEPDERGIADRLDPLTRNVRGNGLPGVLETEHVTSPDRGYERQQHDSGDPCSCCRHRLSVHREPRLSSPAGCPTGAA